MHFIVCSQDLFAFPEENVCNMYGSTPPRPPPPPLQSRWQAVADECKQSTQQGHHHASRQLWNVTCCHT